MKAALRERWVEALRSGRYLQALGKLKGAAIIWRHPETGEVVEDEDLVGYCCLGVLLDVFDSSRWFDAGLYDAGLYESSDPEDEAEVLHGRRRLMDAELDEATLSEVGMDAEQQVLLVRMNDNDKAPFARIADWIEDDGITVEEG